jgi:hypothetical protein
MERNPWRTLIAAFSLSILAHRNETSPIMSTSSDIWSLGCVISIVFPYLDEGAIGVAKYAEKRAAHTRADGCDRFFIRDRIKSRPKLPHPAIRKWHSQLIKKATHRKREGKVAELILRFLETEVFQEQSKQSDAHSVERKGCEALRTYEEWERNKDEERQTGPEILFQSTVIRRIVPRRED